MKQTAASAFWGFNHFMTERLLLSSLILGSAPLVTVHSVTSNLCKEVQITQETRENASRWRGCEKQPLLYQLFQKRGTVCIFAYNMLKWM